jgi:hypothetical protein
VISTGCQPDSAPGRTLLVQARSLDACPVSARAQIELEALGDFEASNRTAESVSANASGRELSFPLSTRTVTAEANDGDERWLGAGSVYEDSAQLPLLPEDRECALHRSEPGSYPAALRGTAWGLSADGRFLLVAGGTREDATGTLIFEIGTGEVGSVADGLRAVHTGASATPFGADFLVSGGESADGVSNVAEVVQATLAPGLPSTIELVTPRAQHAAVVLPSGETLLVGGRSAAGSAPLTFLEAVSPRTGLTRSGRLAVLATGRIDPTVITLTDGRILVAGGHDGAAPTPNPITSLEWLTPDASRSSRPPLDLADFGAAGVHLAFTALPGGAVLAAGNDGENALGVRGPQAYWVSADSFVEVIPLPAPTPDPGVGAPAPLLIPASDGAPFLLLGLPDARRILRFDPWATASVDRFEDADIEITAALPAAQMPKPLAIDAGAFVWLAPDSEGNSLFGLRHDTRGAYTRDLGLLQRTDPNDPQRPLHVAPDFRAGSASVVFDGRLRLGGTGSGLIERVATVFVTDTVYADLDLTLELDAGPPPLVLLGNTELGGPACPWPEPGAAPERLRVLRRGSGVIIIRGGLQRTCEAAEGRLSIGLKQGGAEPSILSELVIRRDIQPE